MSSLRETCTTLSDRRNDGAVTKFHGKPPVLRGSFCFHTLTRLRKNSYPPPLGPMASARLMPPSRHEIYRRPLLDIGKPQTNNGRCGNQPADKRKINRRLKPHRRPCAPWSESKHFPSSRGEGERSLLPQLLTTDIRDLLMLSSSRFDPK